jgi:hypothetical protein
MWYVLDGVSAHFSRGVRDVLSNTYHDGCIGRGGPSSLPPCPPDLNPLDVYLWGHLNVAPIDTEGPLHRTVDACQTVLNCLSIFERMRRSMMRHVEACTGGHFEHLL